MQKHDERTLGTELLAHRDMEANPVGRDVAMPPWPIKQDVAYAGAGHLSRARPGLSANGLLVDDLALDLRRVGGALLLLAGILAGTGYLIVKRIKPPERTIAQANQTMSEVQGAAQTALAAASAPQIEGEVVPPAKAIT